MLANIQSKREKADEKGGKGVEKKEGERGGPGIYRVCQGTSLA